MLEQFLKEHISQITNLLENNYGLNPQQSTNVTNIIMQSIAGFLSQRAQSGTLDVNHLADLLTKNTPNQSNALFGGLTAVVASALSNSGLGSDAISRISTNGLDDILKIFQSGKLGNLDANLVSSVISSLSGKGGGLNSLLGGLTGLFEKNSPSESY